MQFAATDNSSENSNIKKATNLSISQHILADARALNINLSATLELALKEKIQIEKRRQWLENNKEAIENCNALTERSGLFSDKYRVF